MSTDAPRGNSYILDSENPAEMARLINLDRLTTKAMGGPLAGLPDTSGLRNVLDLACGPGGWVLDVAFAHPDIEVAGVDISRAMIDYANARARVQRLTNASFGVMDISKPLDFAEGAFDLINARFLSGAIPREGWPQLIAECMLRLRSGGILRLTEVLDPGVGSSPALERLNAMLFEALWRADYGFSPDGRALHMTVALPRLLRDAGYQNVQYQAHALEFSADTDTWADFYHNLEVAYKLAQPFLVKMGVTTEDEVERIYQQMLIEMHLDYFCGMWHYMTIWGYKP